jgi:hypothetical protein
MEREQERQAGRDKESRGDNQVDEKEGKMYTTGQARERKKQGKSSLPTLMPN